MIKLTKEALQPAYQLKAQVEEWRQLFDAFASMRGEDLSQLSFGHGIPPETNELMATFASRFQAAMAPIEDLRQQILDAIQEGTTAEPGAPPNGGPATSVGNSTAPEGPPSVS